MSTKERLASFKKQMEDAQKALQRQGQVIFHEEVLRIFADYPELTDFSWTQYTPYFNDGDECVFRCGGTSYVYVNYYGVDPDKPIKQSGELYDREQYIGSHSEGKRPGADAPWEKRAAYDITEMIAELGSDLMLSIFGDHAQVMVGREKIVVEAYEHE